jgi:orotidine-5'-phosphate decarboxylase
VDEKTKSPPKDALFSSSFGLVPALDIDPFPELLRVVQATTKVEGVIGYKLGLAGSLRMGLANAIAAIREVSDLPIIYDHQKAGPDMPDMAGKFSGICADAGADALILFPVAGPHAVRSFVGESIRHNMVPVVGGHIPVPDYTISGGGFMVDDVVHRIASIAAESGARHFVLPANDIEGISRFSAWSRAQSPDCSLFLTGFGALGGAIRPAFSAARVARGRYAIVGRAVCAAEKPGDAARRFVEELADVVG